jgi:hypothetical protein
MRGGELLLARTRRPVHRRRDAPHLDNRRESEVLDEIGVGTYITPKPQINYASLVTVAAAASGIGMGTGLGAEAAPLHRRSSKQDVAVSQGNVKGRLRCSAKGVRAPAGLKSL